MINGPIEILLADTAVQALVGRNTADTKYKVYPVIVPQPETAPYCVLRMTSKQLQYKGRQVYDCEFNVSVYHTNYDDMHDLDTAVVNALINNRGEFAGMKYGYIEFVGAYDGYEETYGGLYVRVSSFKCSVDVVTT